MESAIIDYKEAVLKHIQAVQDEMKSKLEVRSTHYTLLRAKEELRAAEREVLG